MRNEIRLELEKAITTRNAVPLKLIDSVIQLYKSKSKRFIISKTIYIRFIETNKIFVNKNNGYNNNFLKSSFVLLPGAAIVIGDIDSL